MSPKAHDIVRNCVVVRPTGLTADLLLSDGQVPKARPLRPFGKADSSAAEDRDFRAAFFLHSHAGTVPLDVFSTFDATSLRWLEITI